MSFRTDPDNYRGSVRNLLKEYRALFVGFLSLLPVVGDFRNDSSVDVEQTLLKDFQK